MLDEGIRPKKDYDNCVIIVQENQVPELSTVTQEEIIDEKS